MAILLFRARAASRLAVTYDGDNLYPVAPPDLHFLTARIVDRLRSTADTERFVSQLSLFSGQSQTPLRQAHAQFVVSYSIWEETFKVAIPGSRSQEGLSAAQAEAWCFENMAISASGLDPVKPFRMRFEVRSQPHRDLSHVLGDMGISLVSLVDIFSRKPGAGEVQWVRETGWLRLGDLPRLTGRPAHRG